MRLKILKISLIMMFLFNGNLSVLANDVVLQKDFKDEKSPGKIMNFLKTYVNRDENPIFKDKTHMVGVIATYDIYGFEKERIVSYYYINEQDILYSYKQKERQLGTIAIHYSRANKLFGLNGRYSVGLYSMFGKDYNFWQKGKIQTFGIEGIQELIIGHPMLYITLGIGISYMMGQMGLPEGQEGLTGFNFVPVATIGHRFDSGLVLELIYKHYSNGNDYIGRNSAVDSVGLAIRYVF